MMIGKKMTFTLDKEEIQRISEWDKNHECSKEHGTMGERLIYLGGSRKPTCFSGWVVHTDW